MASECHLISLWLILPTLWSEYQFPKPKCLPVHDLEEAKEMSAITHGVTSCIYIEVCHYLHGSVFNIHIRDGDISLQKYKSILYLFYESVPVSCVFNGETVNGCKRKSKVDLCGHCCISKQQRCELQHTLGYIMQMCIHIRSYNLHFKHGCVFQMNISPFKTH